MEHEHVSPVGSKAASSGEDKLKGKLDSAASHSPAEVLSGLLRLLLLPQPPAAEESVAHAAPGAPDQSPTRESSRQPSGAGGAGAGSTTVPAAALPDAPTRPAGVPVAGSNTAPAPGSRATGGTILYEAATLAPGMAGVTPGGRVLGLGTGLGVPKSSAPSGDEQPYALLGAGSTRGIEIGDWIVFTHKSHIATDATMERWTQELGFTLPEMVYAENGLHLWHQPSGTWAAFTTYGALREVRRVAARDQIQVPFAAEWQATARRDVAKVLDMDTDWTFSTDYAGTLARYERTEGSGGGSDEAPLTLVEASSGAEFDSAVLTVDGIAYDKLKRRDPILFFDDVPLFDDELHDCGLAALSVKVRVMPERWFVLSQYWMRVDGGLLRAIETRLFHEMGTEEMFRRRTVKEIDAKALQKEHPDVELSKPQSFLPRLPVVSDAYERISLAPPAAAAPAAAAE